MRLLKGAVAVAVLLCGVLSLSGCSLRTSLYLINHTGGTVQVLYSAGRWRDQEGVVHVEQWSRFWPWPFSIDDGVGRRVDYAMGREWIAEVRMARCRLRYEAPMDPMADLRWSASWRGFQHMQWAFTTQLEPDGRLYLVAVPEADDNRPRAVDISPFVPIQPEGFPVEPSSRVCARR